MTGKAFYVNHLQETILPYWHKALDRERGGVFTCFSNDGKQRVSTDKYVWSQARFLWLWSRIATMCRNGVLHADPAPYVDQALRTKQFLEYAFLPNGHCCYLLSEDGAMKEETPGKGYDSSIYADCFVIMGFTELAALVEDGPLLERALQLSMQLEQRIAAGGFQSSPYAIPPGYRMHGIPMIMTNVKQELADALERAGDARHASERSKALAFARSILDDFCDAEFRVREVIPVGSAHPLADTVEGRHLCPGHTIECMWFVMREAEAANDPAMIDKAVRVIKQALELGWDREHGGLYRYVDVDGGSPRGRRTDSPLERLILRTWDMKIWWPHSETLYATWVGHRLTGDQALRQWYGKVHDYTFSTFPNPDKETGEWIQIRDRTGKPAEQIVGLPVKDPYHIMRNLLMLVERMHSLEEGSARALHV